jgi:hypothetical protein
VLAGYEPGAQRQERGWLGRQLVTPPRAGKRMPGFDACFKAPKSVSLLWAFGDRARWATGRWTRSRRWPTTRLSARH